MASWKDVTCGKCLGMYKPVVDRGTSPRIIVLGEYPELSDAVLGSAFVGIHGAFCKELLFVAGIVEPVHYMYIVRCRPMQVTTYRGEDAEEVVTKDRVVACMPLVNEEIADVSPAGIIMLGTTVEKYYRALKKEYTTCRIISPSALFRTGGSYSPYYLETINELKRFYEEIS